MSNLAVEEPKLCKICDQNESKYCCPRCNVLYCSLTCYKSNSHLQCSESFYKECFTEELASMDQNVESKKKMMEILSNVNKNQDLTMEEEFDEGEDNQDSDDDDPVPDLALRLQNIDLDNADAVWESLTEDERRDFEALLSGDVTKVIPVWKPWWLYHKKKAMIVEVEDKDKSKVNYEVDCPRLDDNIKCFSTISKNPPAACVKYNLMNVLTSYVFTARLFNGDHLNMETEAISCLITLSSNLNSGINFEDVDTAIQSVVQESHNNDSFKINIEAQEQMESDLKDVLRGPEDSNKSFYIQCCLSDISTLINKYKKVDKDVKLQSKNSFPYQDSNYSVIPIDKVKVVKKKIEYYQSLVMQHHKDIINALSNDLLLNLSI